jgi:biotin transport system substrate-specific component
MNNENDQAVTAEDQGKTAGRISTRDMIYVAMMTAIIAILAQISFQSPTGVPMTLQTFAIALIAVITGWKRGLASTALYIALGAIGVPVFAGATSGPAVIAGVSGGFLWGFLFLAGMCGVGAAMKNHVAGYALGLAGLAVCHILGIIQFMAVAAQPFGQAFMLVSAPYLIKDVASVVLAYIVGTIVRGRLRKANLI